MRWSSIVHLYRVRLRPRLVQELLAVAGIAIGVALVFAALVANASLTGSVRQLTSGIVGESRYQLAARGPHGFDARLLADVRAIPGVKDAAPILEARAVLAGPSGSRPVLLVGGEPRFARLGGSLVRLFSATQLATQRVLALPVPIAEAIGVRYGGELDVVTGGGGRRRATLGGQLQDADIGSLVHSPVALAPLAYAQELSGMPRRVTRIFVQPEPGREAAVQRALERVAAGQLTVLPADAEVAVFEQAAAPTNQSTALFSVFAALVGFLFALSAVLLTVPQRRRFIADLRLAGHPPGTVMRVLIFDALVLGVAGSGLGLLIGDQLSRRLFGTVPGYLSFAFPVGSQRVVGASCVAIAVAAGLLAACLAVLTPVRDIFFARPTERPPRGTDRRMSHARAAAGVGCLVMAAAVLLAAPAAAIGGMVLLTAALLLLLPAFVRLAVEAIARVGVLVRSAVPALATMELRSRVARTRMFALAATGAIAVFASVAIGSAHRDLLRGLDASAREIDANADIWATFPGEPNAFATTPFALDARTRALVARVPGVEAVRVYRGAFLDVGTRRVWVLAPPADAPAPIPPSQLVEGDRALATRRIRAGGWVVLSEALAEAHGVGVGETFTLPSPRPMALRVAALSTNLGWPPGAMIVNARDFARAWGSPAASALHVRVAAGASPPAVARGVEAALASAPVTVETAAQRQQRHSAAAREGLERLTQISALVLGAAILAMATAMGGMIWQRRPALANLKVDGMTERELWRALLLESALLLGAGCTVGAVFGLGGQVMLGRALSAVTGFPVIYAAGVGVAVGVLAVVLAAALLMLTLPGLLAVRVAPSPRPAR